MSTFDCGTNYLTPTGFKVNINRDNYPNLQFYAQGVQHPDLNLESTEISYPRVGRVGFLGESLTFGLLSMDVLLDEDMNSYRELFDWVHRSVERNHTGYNKNPTEIPSYCDITLSILSSHNNTNKQFKYMNSHPTSIGAVNFTATDAGEYITFPVTFRFDYFEFL
jgi:hypothetical protein